MSRRRYISTDISTDAQLAMLAQDGPLPLLMYTWAIPHMDDWGRMTGDALQFKLLVCPALNVTTREVEDVLEQIASVGLWSRYQVDGRHYLAIDTEKWFRYQTYINKEKRTDDSGSAFPAPPCAAERRTSPQNAEDYRRLPRKAASPSPSPSPSKDKDTCAPTNVAQVSTLHDNDSQADGVEADEVTAQLGSNGRAGQDAGSKPDEQRARAPFKTRVQETRFDEFWAAYPRKRSKGRAEKAWAKIAPDKKLFDSIVAALEQARDSPDWRRDGGKFIPYPATWLNAKGWEDEYDTGARGGVSRGKGTGKWADLYAN